MRAPVLITVLLAFSYSYPALAQEEGKPPASASQPAPAQTKPDSPSSEAGRDTGRMMDRMGPGIDWDHRKAGRDGRLRGAGVDMDRDRGYRGSDRDGYGRRYDDEDRPRRRVKICFEYENGDEYCRYRD